MKADTFAQTVYHSVEELQHDIAVHGQNMRTTRILKDAPSVSCYSKPIRQNQANSMLEKTTATTATERVAFD